MLICSNCLQKDDKNFTVLPVQGVTRKTSSSWRAPVCRYTPLWHMDRSTETSPLHHKQLGGTASHVFQITPLPAERLLLDKSSLLLLTGTLRNASKIFPVLLDFAEAQLGTKFLGLSQWRKELNHLHITRCFVSLFNFPKFPYIFHTLSNISVPHIHESLVVRKKESRIKKANTSQVGPYHFQCSNGHLPEKYYWRVTPCPTQSVLDRHYVYPLNLSH